MTGSLQARFCIIEKSRGHHRDEKRKRSPSTESGEKEVSREISR